MDESIPTPVLRIAEAWPNLPPHVRDAILTLVDAGSATHPSVQESKFHSSEIIVNGITIEEPLIRQLARECRGIVQNCLREEEWQDAEGEFFDILVTGMKACHRPNPG